MKTEDQAFLSNPNLSLWICGLYAQAMDRDPVDAANDADVLAEAMSERMLAICLKQPIPPTVSALVDNRGTSYWLISALLQSLQRDPIEASAEAELLAVALDKRINRPAKMSYSHAMEYLRPRLQKALLQASERPSATSNFNPASAALSY